MQHGNLSGEGPHHQRRVVTYAYQDTQHQRFQLNADGTISGCPNSAPEFQFGHITNDIKSVINSPVRIENIACERARNPICFSCEVFEFCGGDCHKLAWQGDICGAPKSLMKELKGKLSYGNIVSN